jgi:succinate-semialdehyde dehydrogenase
MSHCIQDPIVSTNPQIQELIEKARVAQAAFESFSQEKVDAIVKGIGKYVYDNAEMLARMAVDETGIGVYEDKILKNKGKARIIWNNLKDKKSRGIIGEDPESNMVFVAKPMFAVKTGNAVIFAPHPKAEKCMELLTREFMKVVKANGGPDNLLQTVKNGSIETTQELMKVVDVVVATGGGAMVKSAYSSGKPSFGVGAGNVPVIIDTDADHKDAAGKIVMGASFDNGIICSHEQFVLVHESRYTETIQIFEDTGKVWFTEDEALIQKFRDLVFPGGRLNKDVVGRSPRDLGAMIGVEISKDVRIILLPAKGAGDEDVLAKEKLCPVVAIFPYRDFKEAVEKAKANLLVEGAGHSAGVHSNSEDNIRYAGLELPVSRLVVNQACSFSAGGSLTNGFAPTTTLGCGSWGGNSISENLDYKHLMNVSRIGKLITDKKVPTDAEIWA